MLRYDIQNIRIKARKCLCMCKYTGFDVLLQSKKFMLGRTKTTAICIKDSEISQRHAGIAFYS